MEGKTRNKVAVESNPVTLLNGEVIEAVVAESTLSYLRVMLDADPRGQELIEDLHLLAQGRPQEARPASLAYFKSHVLISGADGGLLPTTRAVVLSAFRRSPDGIVLVEPYQATDANRTALEAEKVRFDEFMRRHIFRPPGSGGQHGR
jgi:hypothetical protein